MRPVSSFVSTVCALLLSAHTARADITPVLIEGGTPLERIGFLVAQEGNCVVVTAAHEIDRRVSMNVAVNGQPRPAALWWNGLRSPEAIDIALLRLNSSDLSDCEPLATPERMASALRTAEGQLWLPSVGGEVLTPGVRTTRRDAKTLTLSLVDPASSPTTKGVSGAPVVFDGVIVGVMRGNTDRQFLATRLDHLLRVAGEEVRLRRLDAPVAVSLVPYDLAGLPGPVAEAVRKARQLREEAELVSRLAQDVERRADDAARQAEEEAKNGTGGNSNRSSYATTGGNRYAGEVNRKSSLLSSTVTTYPQGYGVLSTLTGPFKGGVKKCIWVNEGTGCRGPMVEELSLKGGNWKRIEIDWQEDLRSAPARVLFRSGVIGHVTVQIRSNPDTGGHSYTVVGEGVYDFVDGRRYEGAVNGNGGNGLGVQWDANGRAVRAGLWKDGNAVD